MDYFDRLEQIAERVKKETGIHIREEMQDSENLAEKVAGYLLPLLIYEKFDQIRGQWKMNGKNKRYIMQIAIHKVGIERGLPENKVVELLMTQAAKEVQEEYERKHKEVDIQTAWGCIGLSRLIDRKILRVAHGGLLHPQLPCPNNGGPHYRVGPMPGGKPAKYGLTDANVRISW
ncbi:MAG: hypothetical protein C4542_05155 [Dehalococcoidia bacterium]|nr:MAG: hypothetical protein C4542_05155 [Dehalococcoidia bacterium]